jgi:hypothetical protein
MTGDLGETLNPIFMICQIRGRFGGASVSPLQAPVVVSRRERGETQFFPSGIVAILL